MNLAYRNELMTQTTLVAAHILYVLQTTVKRKMYTFRVKSKLNYEEAKPGFYICLMLKVRIFLVAND